MQHYGWETFRNDFWPTRDGIIPWPLFRTWLEAVNAFTAADQLEMIGSISHSIATAMLPKNKQGPLRRERQKLVKLAYPKVYPHGE